MPAAKKGLRFIETTWKGSKTGDLWEIMKRAMETRPEDMTEEDFHLYFFPWWGDPDYSLQGNTRQISEECGHYLDEVEREIARRENSEFEFTPEQRLWYYKVAWAKGLFRFEEYPTVLEECFRAPIEGAIYAEIIDRLRVNGGMVTGAVDRSLLVHTSWDLGSPINTVVWYFQLIGSEIRVIDCDSEQDITPAERVARILSKGYLLGWHFLPHDALATMKSGKTFLMEVKELGLRNVRVVPKTMDIWVWVNHLRGILPRFTFRVPECEKGLDNLAMYHTKRETAGGTALDVPVHDGSSHYADALRVLAEAEDAGMLGNAGSALGGGINPGMLRHREVRVRTGFRGDADMDRPSSILDRFFGPRRGNVRVIR